MSKKCRELDCHTRYTCCSAIRAGCDNAETCSPITFTSMIRLTQVESFGSDQSQKYTQIQNPVYPLLSLARATQSCGLAPLANYEHFDS